MTTALDDPWLALQQASSAAGLDASQAELIHNYSNAIYLLPAENAVARITYGAGAAERIGRSQAITRWLVRERHFPATDPLGDTPPVVVATAVVSFWTYYPQAEQAPPRTSAHLGTLLRLLHRAGMPPAEPPPWIPLDSLAGTVADPQQSSVLTDDERMWITERITQIREKIACLKWPLGTGLIHGDAWAGNLLACPAIPPAGAVLSDWDWVSTGPREVDLIPTWHAALRYGKGTAWIADFVDHYGYDLRQWSGYPVLMAMRDLVQLSGPIRRAPDSEPHYRVFRQRLDSLRSGDKTSSWKAL